MDVQNQMASVFQTYTNEPHPHPFPAFASPKIPLILSTLKYYLANVQYIYNSKKKQPKNTGGNTVLMPVHLAFSSHHGLVQLNSNPFPCGELRLANVLHCPFKALAHQEHPLANFQMCWWGGSSHLPKRIVNQTGFVPRESRLNINACFH